MPVVGTAALTKFADHVFDGSRTKIADFPARRVSPMRLKKIEWPTLQVPLTFVLGKGGVGKTTISAALGFSTRKKKQWSGSNLFGRSRPVSGRYFSKGNRRQSCIGSWRFTISRVGDGFSCDFHPVGAGSRIGHRKCYRSRSFRNPPGPVFRKAIALGTSGDCSSRIGRSHGNFSRSRFAWKPLATTRN